MYYARRRRVKNRPIGPDRSNKNAGTRAEWGCRETGVKELFKELFLTILIVNKSNQNILSTINTIIRSKMVLYLQHLEPIKCVSH